MNLRLLPFDESDVALLTPIMKRAFDEDTKRHLNEPEGGPPGYDNGDFLRKWALHPASTARRIERDGRLIGGVVLWINENGENNLGNIFLDPEVQDRGLGTAVWKLIEETWPETRVWRTETPGFSKRNHNFYVNKCGFHVVRIEKPGDPREESYILEKIMPRDRRALVEEYFRSWIDKDIAVMGNCLDDDVRYAECYGPEYRGKDQCLKWFEEWNRWGSVLEWRLKDYRESGEDCVVEWYFRCEFEGKEDGFDGVSLIQFSGDKIIEVKEFQSKADHYFPYGIAWGDSSPK